jgi:hypothetical protein
MTRASRSTARRRWAKLEAESRDLVVLDLMLPGIEGLEVMRHEGAGDVAVLIELDGAPAFARPNPTQVSGAAWPSPSQAFGLGLRPPFRVTPRRPGGGLLATSRWRRRAL